MRQRLDGWKAIAGFLGRNERTAQLWERERGLPVHRVHGGPRQSLFAYADELDAWMRNGAPAAGASLEAPAPALLVLPFGCSGAGASLPFVADGLAEELISRLACTPLSSLRVLSWTTAKVYRDLPIQAQRLSRELGVRYFIEGNMLAAGERWRVNIRLVDAQADQVVFSDRFSCGGREILLLQSQIAEAVAGHLALVMTGDLTEPMWTREVDPAAFLCYLKGLQGFAEGSMPSLTASMEHLQEALRIDPGFLPATAMLGITLLQADNYHVRRDPDVVERVHQISRTCLREAPSLITVSFLDAAVASMYDFDWSRSESRLTQGLKLMPSSVALRGRLANTLSIQRRHEEADAVFRPAHLLDQSLEVKLGEARNRLWRRDFAGAGEGFERILQENPQHVYAQVMRVMAAFYQGDARQAQDCMAALPRAVQGQFRDLNEGCLAALEGRTQAARACRDRIAGLAGQGRGRWYYATMIDGLLGDGEAAGHSLGQALEAQEISCTIASVDPSLDAVRQAPAVRRVIAAMGLPA